MAKKEEIQSETIETETIAEETLPEIPATVSSEECPLVKEIEAEEAAEKEAPLLSAEDFYKNIFKPVFNISGTLTGYESLKINELEEPGARATSDELFKIVEKSPVLGFMRKADWVERYFLIGIFIFAKGQAVRAEYREKRKPLPGTPAEAPKENKSPAPILG